MRIEAEVVGTFCNSWPNMVIELNGEILFDGNIKDRKKIVVESDRLQEQGNKILLGMNNKSFGKNGIWDTKMSNNKIEKDKTISVLSLKLDDVECKQLFRNCFHVKRADRQPSYFPDVIQSTDTMNYNGYFTFNFDIPLYKSLINQKFKIDSKKKISYFSNYTKVFHYEEEQEIINKIKSYLKEIDEKFSDKRTKIRNS